MLTNAAIVLGEMLYRLWLPLTLTQCLHVLSKGLPFALVQLFKIRLLHMCPKIDRAIACTPGTAGLAQYVKRVQ